MPWLPRTGVLDPKEDLSSSGPATDLGSAEGGTTVHAALAEAQADLAAAIRQRQRLLSRLLERVSAADLTALRKVRPSRVFRLPAQRVGLAPPRLECGIRPRARLLTSRPPAAGGGRGQPADSRRQGRPRVLGVDGIPAEAAGGNGVPVDVAAARRGVSGAGHRELTRPMIFARPQPPSKALQEEAKKALQERQRQLARLRQIENAAADAARKQAADSGSTVK